MKKLLRALPIFVVASVAGCSSNTTAPVESTTTQPAAGTTSPNANGIPTPYVAKSGTLNAGNVVAPAASTSGVPASGVPKPNISAPGGKMPQIPPGLSMGSGAVLPASPDFDKKIAALQNGDKKKLAQAYADRGTLRMNDPNAGPRVKYRAALADYRLALKADPKNPEALASKKQIEDIYKMMGRPIPQ